MIFFAVLIAVPLALSDPVIISIASAGSGIVGAGVATAGLLFRWRTRVNTAKNKTDIAQLDFDREKITTDREYMIEMRQEVKELRTKVGKLSEENGDLRGTVRELTVRVEHVEEDNKRKDILLKEKEGRIKELDEINSKLRHRVQDLTSENVRIKAEINAMDVAAHRTIRYPDVQIGSLLTSASEVELSHPPREIAAPPAAAMYPPETSGERHEHSDT